MPRFFTIREAMLVEFEADAKGQKAWERQCGGHRGGWAGEGAGWVVRSTRDVWRHGETLCDQLNAFHPRGVVPLVGSDIQARHVAVTWPSHGHHMAVTWPSRGRYMRCGASRRLRHVGARSRPRDAHVAATYVTARVTAA